MSRNILFFFPYAGASSVTFHHWEKAFPPEIDFFPFDYAGHGKRRNKTFYTTMEEACNDIYDIIKNNVGKYDNYYIGGHCYGAVIAFEMYYLIKERKQFKIPEGIFLSGQGTPNIKNYRFNNYSLMDDHDLLKYLYDTGAVKSDMLDEEIFDYVSSLVLAPVKADSRIIESYKFEPKQELIESRLFVMYGREDPFFPPEEIKEWSSFADKPVKYYDFEGGHYIIINHWEQCIDTISRVIAGKGK